MNIKNKLSFAIISLLYLHSYSGSTATAQSVKLNLSGDLNVLSSKFSSVENSALSSPIPAKFEVTSPQFGSLSVTFSEQPRQSRNAFFIGNLGSTKDTAEVLLLKGVGNINGQSVPVAGSVYRQNGVPELHINFVAPASKYNSKSTAVEVTQNLDGGTPVVEVPNATLLEGKKCGVEYLPKVRAPLLSNGSSNDASSAAVVALPATLKQIDVATDADFQYFSRYGSSTNSRIASVANAAQVIYERDLGLRINIIRQRVRTSSSQPYISSNSETLLDQLSAEVNSTGGLQGADIVHLFTGKDLNDNVVGLAWLGVTCTTPSLSTSLTQAVSSSVDPIIFAHEIGHNLGADHDSRLPRSLMYPMAGSDQNFVSQISKNEIANYFNTGGDSCFSTIADSSPTPTPTPTSTATPTPTPTSGGGGGGGGGGGSGSDAGNTSTGVINFSASFNKSTGQLTVSMARSRITGICTAAVSISTRANLTGAQGVEFDSSASKLTFTARTPKRISSARGKIYVGGSFYNCADGNEVDSEVFEISPGFDSKTRKTDKVASKTWILSAVQKMTVKQGR